ncbi:MAG: hypothetical protein QOJ06_972 [Pseudonocardiales bacterium]|jgi:hypothetical protein|nr:hypothetical protein [Pseudonocardiales bacterium]
MPTARKDRHGQLGLPRMGANDGRGQLSKPQPRSISGVNATTSGGLGGADAGPTYAMVTVRGVRSDREDELDECDLGRTCRPETQSSQRQPSLLFVTTKPGDLSVTALYTSQVWVWGGLSHAHLCSRTKMPNAVRRDNAVLEPSRMFNDKFASLRHSLLHRDLRFGRPDTDEGGDRAGHPSPRGGHCDEENPRVGEASSATRGPATTS